MGEIVMSWLISFLILTVGILWLLHVLSKTDRHATTVENGGFKFIVKGNTLIRVLDNLTGCFVDIHTNVVVEDSQKGSPLPVPLTGVYTRRRKGFLEIILGIMWVSWIWPLKRVHEFKVVADKFKDKNVITDKKLPVRQQLEVDVRDEKYLRHRFPHPVLITDVELGKDRWKIDIIVMLDIMVIKPTVVVFDYKGQVLRQVDAAVSSAVIDFCKNLSYEKFVKMNKGTDSPFAKKILKLNDDTTSNPDPDGLRDRFGVEIRTVMMEVFDLSPEQKKLDEAAQAVEQKRLEAEARIQEARGQQAYERMTREGIAEGTASMIEKLKNAGLKPEEAIRIAHEQVRMGNVAASKLTTYVEGNGNVQPTIPVK